MGEIADDCYDRAENDLADMSLGQRWEFEHHMALCAQFRAQEAHRRRVASRDSTRDMFSNLDDPPF